MSYTIKRLAKMSGVTIRTLHYYDQIGLLKPSFISENGYRHYEEKELLRLQQILFYRELEFPLEKIKSIIDNPNFDIIGALNNHRKLLSTEKKRLQIIIKTIDKTINKIKGEEMKDEELFGGLTKKQQSEYEKEARERWGSEHVDESKRRLGRMSKQEQKQLFEEGMRATVAIADKMDQGLEPSDPSVQAEVAKHHAHINNFYDCSLEIYRGLGHLYINDPRFTAYYEKVRPNLAQFMQKAMDYYCDQQEKK